MKDTLKRWLDNPDEKKARKAPTKGSKKGCMKGKGGPQNQHCNYRGVRQGNWGGSNPYEKKARKAPDKGSKEGCMKGKRGPQNQHCNYMGMSRGLEVNGWRKSTHLTKRSGSGSELFRRPLTRLWPMTRLRRLCTAIKIILNMPKDSGAIVVTPSNEVPTTTMVLV
ncbi:hypothetical protein V6N13_140828 [Hibiscus sabdariffa]|uniref:Uncharacterized protein n=1 Tax=Hibiscus sabdariffa TaxID=183260 RepID=A0ABR2Q1T4_9ROSI